MNANERAIYHYLKSLPGQFVPAQAISRHVGGIRKFRAQPQWAMPVLSHLVDRQVLECDKRDGYRINPQLLEKIESKRKLARWISPNMRRIMESSAKNLSNIISLDDPEESVLNSL